MTLGEKVKIRREELGFSQEELAEKLGYKSKTSIHKIEQNITDLPLSKVSELAKVLGVTSSYLMGWTEEKILHTNTPEKEKEKVLTAARDRKTFDKLSKLDEKKRKIVEDLIDSYFDEIQDE